MPKLTAIENVKHDGQELAAGDTFDVKTEDQAEALVEAGVAVRSKAAAAKGDKE